MSRIAVLLALPLEYNTSSMLRCKTIISALARQGHFVKCYSPSPDTNSKYYSSKPVDLGKIEIQRYGKVIRSGAPSKTVVGKTGIKSKLKNKARQWFRKIDVFGSTLLLLPNRKWLAQNISQGNFDILISFSDPMPAHMIGKYCKRKNPHIRYIQQWGDPLASDTISKIAQPVWMRKIIERSLLKPADRVCYVSPFTHEEQKTLFPKFADRMIFLPTPSLEYQEDGSITAPSEKLCIGYFGSYYSSARDLVPFYEAAKTFPDVQFLIIGDSNLSLTPTDHISVLKRVPPDELQQFMDRTHVLVCLMNKKGNQIPGKVYHDASSKKDILFIKDGEYGDQIQTFFEAYDHYTFTRNSQEDITFAIENYLKNGVPERRPVKEFSADYIAGELIR